MNFRMTTRPRACAAIAVSLAFAAGLLSSPMTAAAEELPLSQIEELKSVPGESAAPEESIVGSKIIQADSIKFPQSEDSEETISLDGETATREMLPFDTGENLTIDTRSFQIINALQRRLAKLFPKTCQTNNDAITTNHHEMRFIPQHRFE